MNASTGPKSAAGKAVSSRNAIRHGLTSVSPILPSEDQSEYDHFLNQTVTQYDPQDSEDTAIVHAYVDTMWRVRRVPSQEARYIALEIRRIQMAAAEDRQLSAFISPMDPVTLEMFAQERLSESRTLLNLHRQEQRLNRKLKDLKPDLDRIMNSSKRRYLEHIRKTEAARDAQMRDQQNELVAAAAAFVQQPLTPSLATAIRRELS
jgi:hypothetical protein